MSEKRALFTTKIGVIAATVGSAVGLGNIWRFPYETGVHGGAAFLFVYLICVFLIGIPVICAEFIVGRGTHKNALGAFKQLQTKPYWQVCSYIGILASLMILSFYSVIAGWTLEYLFQALTGAMASGNTGDFSNKFNEFCTSPWQSTLWTVLFLLINYLVLRRGVEKGIERISNILMPILFVILILFSVNSLLMPKSSEGLAFLFSPDFSKITPTVVVGAMGQAFFSLSLGLSVLLTYSSYFSNQVRLVRSASIIAILDTFVAIISGIIIFPAVFSYGATPEEGPKLVFEIFPSIFSEMPGGYIWSVLFFVLLFFASITSTISMSEISIAFFVEEYKMKRKKATKLTTGVAIVFGVLSALSFGVLSGYTILDMTIFDILNYVSSNILLPIGGILFSIFVGWVVDKDFVKKELTNNGTIKVYTYRIIIFLIRYVAPISIVLIFLSGLNLIRF
ncbi:MAG: sodium-dependent transporter [Muribaculaceae bacterium]|nr:sodium-dependent transporter [Muribaculaceae bacterium]